MSKSNILPLIPLIASTALTTIGVDAVVSIPALLNLNPTGISKYFNTYFYGLIGPIISLGSTASVLGSYIYFRKGGNAYFGWGAVFAGLHYAYVPLIMYPCQTILEYKGNEKESVTVNNAVKKWVRIHKFRLVSDIMATVCFTLAIATQD